MVAALAIAHTDAVLMYALFLVLILVILRLVLRRTWLAVAAFFVVGVGAFWPAFSSPAVQAIFTLLSGGVFLCVLFRHGFLSVAVSWSVSFLLICIPITYEVSSWIFGGTLVTLAVVFGLALFGLRIALAGRPLFRDELDVSVPHVTVR